MFFDCPHCSTQNDDNRRYCSACGETLGCPECGFINDDFFDTERKSEFYCGGCGSLLSLESNAVLELNEHHHTPTVAEQSPESAHTDTPNTQNCILGYALDEVLGDLQSENNGEAVMHIGGPEHFDQGQLDDLFDV